MTWCSLSLLMFSLCSCVKRYVFCLCYNKRRNRNNWRERAARAPAPSKNLTHEQSPDHIIHNSRLYLYTLEGSQAVAQD